MAKAKPLTKNQQAYQDLLKAFTKACLGEMVGLTRQAITRWRSVPLAHVDQLSKQTGWPPEKLRPEPYSIN